LTSWWVGFLEVQKKIFSKTKAFKSISFNVLIELLWYLNQYVYNKITKDSFNDLTFDKSAKSSFTHEQIFLRPVDGTKTSFQSTIDSFGWFNQRNVLYWLLFTATFWVFYNSINLDNMTGMAPSWRDLCLSVFLFSFLLHHWPHKYYSCLFVVVYLLFYNFFFSCFLSFVSRIF